jgi:DNA-binding MarR family transcriptional regulator
MTRLVKIFASKAQTKLLQYLLEHSGSIFNQALLARRLDLSPTTIARVLEPLVEEGIINYERVSSQMKIIALNDESEKTHMLVEFNEKLRQV